MLRVHTAALAGICYDTVAKNNQRCHRGRWTVRWCVHWGGEQIRRRLYIVGLQLPPSDTLQVVRFSFFSFFFFLPLIAAITAVLFIPLFPPIWQPLLTPPIWTALITRYFQMITAEVFANSKAIWLIRAFGLALHNGPHVPPSACRRADTAAQRLLPLLCFPPIEAGKKIGFISKVCFCQSLIPFHSPPSPMAACMCKT